MRIKRTIVLAALALTTLPACGDDDPADTSPDQTIDEAIRNYGNIVYASYEDSANAALELDAASASFILDPSEDGLDAAREAWLASREPYLQTEVYRFYDGPIDNTADGPEGLINAWPLDENYIDYVETDDSAGIVNDPEITIDLDELERLNEEGGEANIATGFHAAEFLLWGQDLSETEPGARPYTDYVEGADGTAANQVRRGEYLTTVTAGLVGHLRSLSGAWDDGGGNYRADFEAADRMQSLAKILTGMTVLSGFETGGERIETALESNSQEDEHSCFSDNTHRDMVQDVQGVMNVWLGAYVRSDGSSITGTGIRDVVMAKDADLGARLDDAIGASMDAAEALEPPFDREIAADNPEGNARVEALAAALREQAMLLEEVFGVFGLDIPVTP